ncbi:hypothetical protein [Mesorhizobium erdmanii]|uniref:hypothetical protein n=1 Tax=Mesorhizobium erdmanii TaxID=1777866 RepID=UPI0012DB50D0|nr:MULTISPECIES: hypothetical protein [Mesorhizobium]
MQIFGEHADACRPEQRVEIAAEHVGQLLFLVKFSRIESTISLAMKQLRLSTWPAAFRKVVDASLSSPLICLADNNSDASSSSSTDSLTCSAASATARGLVASSLRRSLLGLVRDFFFAMVTSQLSVQEGHVCSK